VCAGGVRHGDDDAYVWKLAQHLSGLGLPVWYDSEIVSGDRWHQLIQRQVDTRGAFAVVMTPAAEESRWVNLEVQRAEEERKPILPLLLAGRAFFRLADLQYDDVRGGRMPGPPFLDRLRGHLGWAGGGGPDGSLDLAYQIVRPTAAFGQFGGRQVQVTVTAAKDPSL
jgi:hypothetical protein